ncbi:type II toxin-antitoxin system RelE/ParE family toxin [Patescibacteria group bacterium]|nr:type II toxin-antitoxin system RelE/ParE family toxin [Patescibacteria group bacterium]
MEIRYNPSVAKQLNRLAINERGKVVRKFTQLSDNPFVGKKLRGELKNLYSIKAWPYRIIYQIKGNKILVYSVKHRQGSYR